MELWSLFLSAFIVGFSGALMPGPLLAVDIAETPRRGMITGPIIVLGHAIAELAVVILLSVGLAALAKDQVVSNVIGIVGGAMLILMAIGMFRQLKKAGIETAIESGDAKKTGRLVLDGIITSLSNPFWFVWWATTGSAFLVQSLRHGIVGPPVFYIGHILSDLVWYSLVSILIWKGRKMIVGTGYKILIAVCALFLLYLGGMFIYSGITGSI
ncbi:MAG: lysine transporter LysE [candidate division Zixibacteria bacterium HGW-Zixibacteria-1]|nr:MAG: lysine transporter LysE [candidate division Zixibacteria bacterium HGW-Zixibacteria-1]